LPDATNIVRYSIVFLSEHAIYIYIYQYILIAYIYIYAIESKHHSLEVIYQFGSKLSRHFKAFGPYLGWLKAIIYSLRKLFQNDRKFVICKLFKARGADVKGIVAPLTIFQPMHNAALKSVASFTSNDLSCDLQPYPD
jgi:hypothetical protein